MKSPTLLYLKSRALFITVVLAALALSTLTLLGASTRPDDADTLQQPEHRFEYARTLYRQHQWSAAYGRFAALADAGNAEAACIALFMVRQGPDLYDNHWSASRLQIQRWTRLSRCRTESFVADGGD